jgi:hypothetical protein
VEALVITWRELLIVAIVVLGVYAAEILLLLRWSSNRGTNVWKRSAQAGPESQRLTAVSLEMAELRKQVTRLESEVEKLRAAGIPASSPYNQAIQLARQGASASDVASTCGISRGEAELIVALYRKLRI